jgi:hypothetical protein
MSSSVTAAVFRDCNCEPLRTPQPPGTSSTPSSLDPETLANLLSRVIGCAIGGVASIPRTTHNPKTKGAVEMDGR